MGGVIMVKVNGKELDIAGESISEFLKSTDYDLRVIAVERNEEIVLKSMYDKTILKDEDVVEIVSFVGGG
jgi:sulfur carrier protein